MKILVIVVTYNGLRWLERCLGSVRASELPADLYVWDNDSTDGSADFVQGVFRRRSSSAARTTWALPKATTMACSTRWTGATTTSTS